MDTIMSTFIFDKYNFLKVTSKFLKDIHKLKENFVILPNQEIIYNKEIFLDILNLYNIKFIKLEKDFLILINNESIIKYAYAPKIIKNVFKGIKND